MMTIRSGTEQRVLFKTLHNPSQSLMNKMQNRLLKMFTTATLLLMCVVSPVYAQDRATATSESKRPNITVCSPSAKVGQKGVIE